MRREAVGHAGLGLFSILMTICFLAPCIVSYNPTCVSGTPFEGPSRTHWLGTNELGQDIWSRLLHGGRNSIAMALAGAAVTTLIGTLIGMAAGYFQGGVDQVLCRLIDILMALPVFPLIILVAVYFSPAVHWLGMLMGALGWGPCARIIRSQSLSLTEWNFVQGARAMGASSGYILARYLFPFILPLSVAKLVLAVQAYLLMGVGLGFAGLGDSSDLEWGQMLHEAYDSGALAIGCWSLLLAPVTAVVITSLSIALMSYGFENRFDLLRSRNGRRLVVE